MTSSDITQRTLLIVTGLFEQVVTETVYALAHEDNGRSVPNEVHIITTLPGADNVRKNLLAETPGWFERLRQDYALPHIHLTEDTLHVIRGENNQPLEDIRTPEDNVAAADTITDLIRELTRDKQTQLHVSIAGGRKSMGFFAGYALSVFGRSYDRLSHVLVSEDFEANPEFYYPTPYSNMIDGTRNKKGVLLDTAEASVTLAKLPFIPLRHGLPKKMLQGKTSFGDAVLEATRTVGTPRLILDRATGTILAADKVIQLAPVTFAFYAWIADRHICGHPPISSPDEDTGNMDYAEEYLNEYGRLNHAGHSGVKDGSFQRVQDSLEKNAGITRDYLYLRVNALRRELNQALGRHAKPYLLSTIREATNETDNKKEDQTLYILDGLTPDQISFERIT